jgi:hypothetical protein
MNVIRIKGGLGNQLFQYAFARCQVLNGINVTFDTEWFKVHTIPDRPYLLDKFKTIEIESGLMPGKRKLITQDTKENLELLMTDASYYDGYWQYLNYYNTEPIYNILQQEIQVKDELLTKEFYDWKSLIKEDSIAIHVRRGDYGAHNGFGYLPFKYYYEAVSNCNKGDLFIFSDDLKWCKGVFKKMYFSSNIYFVHLTDYLEFELMRIIPNKVISHSTFSWWPAFIGESKTVVAPKEWIGGKPTEQIYPANWIKI